MHFTRRQMMVGFGLMGFLRAPRVHANPMIAVAAVAFASAVLDSMRRSGDNERDFAALSMQIDQILRNQIVIMNAISALAEDVQRMVRLLEETPARVLAYQKLVDAHSLLNVAADTFASRQLDPASAKLNKQWRDHQRSLYMLAADLNSIAKNSDKPTDLVIATDACLTLLRSFVAVGDLDDDGRREMRYACIYLRETALVMASQQGIDKHLPAVMTKIEAGKELVEKSDLHRLLPAEFSVATPQTSGMPSQTSYQTFCLASKKGVRRHYKRYTMRQAVFEVEATGAFGGRRIYVVKTTPEERWASASFYYGIGHPRPPREHATAWKDCKRTLGMKYDDEGIPAKEFGELIDALGEYDRWVAWESRLLALKATALGNLQKIDEIQPVLE